MSWCWHISVCVSVYTVHMCLEVILVAAVKLCQFSLKEHWTISWKLSLLIYCQAKRTHFFSLSLSLYHTDTHRKWTCKHWRVQRLSVQMTVFSILLRHTLTRTHMVNRSEHFWKCLNVYRGKILFVKNTGVCQFTYI